MTEEREAIIASSGTEEAETRRLARRKMILRRGLIGLILGSVCGLVLPFIFTGILHLLGFGIKGIVPGSIAAEIQAHMGNITKGTVFAWCQKIGMKGFGGGIIGAVISLGLFLGWCIGAVVGKLKKLPEISDQEGNHDIVQDPVSVEHEDDADLYDDVNDPAQDLERGHQDEDDENLLAIEHNSQEVVLASRNLINFED